MNTLIYHANGFCGPNALGNPAAVCLLRSRASTEWMQAVAQQMNLPQTCFLFRRGSDDFELRFFTSSKEMTLCGHATLCAAHIAWSESWCATNAGITFHTASGPLVARNVAAAIEISLPASPCHESSTPDWLTRAIAVSPVQVLACDTKYLIEVATQEEVEAIKPDFAVLRAEADRGVIVTARSARSDYDIVSRYFAGYAGVDEDPATGSAHCCLVPYWRDKLKIETIRARQVSSRGGEMRGRVQGDRVVLTAKAQTVLSGELRT